ncbi:type IV secretory system conjugative DNA transfer family protein [Pseudaestuariivita rosea]|uniref:type IV secretory system conjugative DNA transfer family protein n=1 Tax=Pseudaestuariivita rosea TaxID=2763263 RepID=UPI001ABB551B|nr:type IV secretory system conjugative DNA transfer family protein [Pseudaestuariivita rosea]
MSDTAKDVRQVLSFVILLAVIITILIFDGFIGWSLTFFASLIGFFAALGWWARTGLTKLAETPNTFGSSRWATTEDLTQNDIFGDEGICIGERYHEGDEAIQLLSYKGERHLLTVAPTRSGKGATQIIPNLLTYEGSALVIDPKGENARTTAQCRKDMGQDVHIVDPWGVTAVPGIETSQFNPLDWLDITDVDITENAMLLADALVVGDNHSDSFWNEEARALLQGLILYVATAKEEDGRRTLSRVRQLLLLEPKAAQDLYQKMAKSLHHIVASTGMRCIQKDPELLSNVLATTQAQTHFLDSSRLQENLSQSSFRFEDLKSKPMTIYLVLPADRLNAFGRWLRLLVQQAITVNARDVDNIPKPAVLFILDEFAALGRLTMVEQAYGLMAGFGIQLWGIVQDLNQLERIYDKGWQSFISNAGMINYFGSSDKMTAEYFSALCGEKTVWTFSTAVSRAIGRSSGSGGGSSSDTTTTSDTHAAAQRKLIYPDELMRLGSNQQLILIENVHPIIAQRTEWFNDEDLKDLGVNLYAEQ